MVTKHTQSVARILPRAASTGSPHVAALPARLLRVGLQAGDHAGNPHDDVPQHPLANLQMLHTYSGNYFIMLLGLATIDHQMRHVES